VQSLGKVSNYTITVKNPELKAIPTATVNVGAFSGKTNIKGDAILDIPTSIKQTDNQVPIKAYVKQNYPNPAGNETTINFGIKETQNITATFYNILGQKVFSETYQNVKPGHHAINIKSIGGLANGIYVSQIQGKDFNEIKKILHFKEAMQST
jgi:hypothetical protein